MKIKVEWLKTVGSDVKSTAHGEFLDYGLIEIKLPYWVNPDVYKAITDAYCKGEMSGSVDAKDRQGGTTIGYYKWEILK